MKTLIRLLMSIALALLTPLSLAAPPQTINYQGNLTNASAVPVNGPVVMTFRLYNAASGGSLLYMETQLSVNISNGSFNAVIGTANPITLPFDVPYWLSVAINSDPEMAPRQPLASSPYAFRASSLDGTATFAGSQITGVITSATLPTISLTGTISTAQIGINAVTQDKLSPTSGAAAGKVLGTDGTNLQWQTVSVASVISVGTGSGLTGGPITSSGTINLATTQLLPTVACATNQISKWNGTTWACAADDNAPPGGASGQVLAFVTGVPTWTSSPSLGGNLTLAAASTASVGSIFKGGNRFIHNFGNSNTFIGVNAGNVTLLGNSNTGGGSNALTSLTIGSRNTALGESALTTNTNGNENSGIGRGALSSNTSGSLNTAVGASALASNTTASGNTAVGASALNGNSTGGGNTATGETALYNNTTGSFNTATGSAALRASTIGGNNTAIGGGALANNIDGNSNTAIGFSAMTLNVSGGLNTALGDNALFSGTGFDNIAIGANAGNNLTTGNNNLVIGNPGVAAESATIRIGGVSQNRTFIAGIRGVTTVNADAIPVVIDNAGQLGTVSSSRRFKDDIADMDSASSALMNLRPVTFHYKSAGTPAGRTLHYGLIAEEVAEIYPGLVAHSVDGQIETVMYQHLPPMLLNEFQKQQRTIAAQAAEISALKEKSTRVDALERDLQIIKAMLDAR